jgi:hypothetical protein
MNMARFIVWRSKDRASAQPSQPLASMLSAIPGLRVLRSSGDAAVVMMSESTARAVRRRLPELKIEQDVRYSAVGS